MQHQQIVYILIFRSPFKNGYRPDLVISGINIGANMGEDITYSGTASAAMEAVIHGVPAIAISQVCKDMCRSIVVDWDFELACKVILDLIARIKMALSH